MVLILGAAFSFGMYFVSQTLGDYLVFKNHLSEEASLKRLTGYQESFENYISKNHLSVKNVRAISKWVKSHKFTYLTIYDGDETLYESGFWNDAYSPYETASSIWDSKKQTKKDITFSDGTYSVSIIDSSEIK